jgi:hypothetical protein
VADYPAVLVIGSSCLVFLACAYFTRAPGRRALAALVSGIAIAGLNIAADIVAHNMGWWHYPVVGDRSYGPVHWYVAAAVAVSGLTLIGWRAHRRFGPIGTVVFLVGLAGYGTTRDWLASQVVSGVIAFGPGPVPWIADYLTWFTCAALALLVQAGLRGHPRRDAPRPRLDRHHSG